MRTLRQKVRQKCVPLGRKSSFGMELSRPQGPPFPPERNAEFVKSIEFYDAFCDMSDLISKRRWGRGEVSLSPILVLTLRFRVGGFNASGRFWEASVGRIGMFWEVLRGSGRFWEVLVGCGRFWES